MNNFFVDLVSNASMDFFPDNTLSRFSNKMVSPVELEGEWEVAVNEIFYPRRIEITTKNVIYSVICHSPELQEDCFIMTHNRIKYSTDQIGPDLLRIINISLDEITLGFNETESPIVTFTREPVFSQVGDLIEFDAGIEKVRKSGEVFVPCLVYIEFKDPTFYEILGFTQDYFFEKARNMTFERGTFLLQRPMRNYMDSTLLFI